MDIASQAVVGGLLRVAVGAIAAAVMYRVTAPSADSRGPIASGRRFFAWTAAIACLTYFGKWVFAPSADNFALWAIAVVVCGGAAFPIGLVWGALKTSRGAAASNPQVKISASEPWNPEAKKILEVRLAKGEISISEFRALINTLGGSVVDLKEESKAKSDPATWTEDKKVRVEAAKRKMIAAWWKLGLVALPICAVILIILLAILNQ